MADVNLAQLLAAGVHFGHKSYRWNPKMFPYIYTERNDIHIIDLVQTAYRLKCAQKFLYREARVGKTFLFIGTKRQASAIIAQEAKRVEITLQSKNPYQENAPTYLYYVNHRWLGGMLTNWSTVQNRIQRLKTLEIQESDGTFNLLPKKEASSRLRELEKLRRHLNGIKSMVTLPDVAIIIDQKREMTAIKECRKLGIKIVSIVDTNCDPDLVDFPIPGNDDAVRSIKLILNSLTKAILDGRSDYKEKLKAYEDRALLGEILYMPSREIYK